MFPATPAKRHIRPDISRFERGICSGELRILRALSISTSAVISAPPFLSGLTPSELGVVRQSIEARADPEIAAAKQAALRALSETESGVRAAIRQISERGNVARSGVV